MHETSVADIRTGEILSEIDKCKECLMRGCKCGKMHETSVADIRTGEILREIDKCKECLMREWEDGVIAEWGGSARCMTSDGRNVNMAEELNRLERELLK